MADPIEIRVSVGDALAYINGKRDAVEEMILQRIDFVNQIFLDRVRTNLGGEVLNMRSGQLFASAQKTPATRDGEVIAGDVHAGGDGAPYGIYFEDGGLGPYVIRPVNAKALFFAGLDGKAVFAQIVHHPAIPHKPWFQPAQDQTEPEMAEAIEGGIREVLSE